MSQPHSFKLIHNTNISFVDFAYEHLVETQRVIYKLYIYINCNSLTQPTENMSDSGLCMAAG